MTQGSNCVLEIQIKTTQQRMRKMMETGKALCRRDCFGSLRNAIMYGEVHKLQNMQGMKCGDYREMIYSRKIYHQTITKKLKTIKRVAIQESE